MSYSTKNFLNDLFGKQGFFGYGKTGGLGTFITGLKTIFKKSPKLPSTKLINALKQEIIYKNIKSNTIKVPKSSRIKKQGKYRKPGFSGFDIPDKQKIKLRQAMEQDILLKRIQSENKRAKINITKSTKLPKKEKETDKFLNFIKEKATRPQRYKKDVEFYRKLIKII